MRAFGMRNSLKCLQALASLGAAVHKYRRVCDLGCGSGAFSLAFAYLAGNPELQLHGLDISEHQLSLARELISAAALPGRFEFEQQNLPARIGYLPDLTISSYWFCENEHVIADTDLFDLVAGRELLVVDYEKIIDRIATALPRGFRILARHSGHVEIPSALTDFVAQERASVYGIHIGRVTDEAGK
jgi:SAM-dependent methyltransferase